MKMKGYGPCRHAASKKPDFDIFSLGLENAQKVLEFYFVFIFSSKCSFLISNIAFDEQA